MKWHLAALPILGWLAAVPAGCSVGPAYRRPDIALPTQWQESAGARAGGNDSVAAWPAADWWRAFGSETLDGLIAGAALLPSLDAGVTVARQRAQVNGAGPRVFNTFNPEFTASYEIDFWGKNRALRDAARAAAGASRFDRQTVALTVVSSVAGTYFQALELRDRIDVARQNLSNGEKILEGFQLEQSAGTATALDVA